MIITHVDDLLCGSSSKESANLIMQKLKEEWPDITDPTGVLIDDQEAAWVISGQLHRVLKYGLDGELQHSWGAYGGSGGVVGGMSRPHQIDVDQEGSVYVASWFGGWRNKFTPKPDADPDKLLGRRLVLER